MTTDVAMKFVPVRVSVNDAPPVNADVGAMVVSVGAGLFTENVCAEVAPPPGAGFVTVIAAVPDVATYAAGTVTVN